MNILADGRQWFADVRTEHVSVDVQYTRGVQALDIKATLGRRAYDAEVEGVIFELISHDFIVNVRDLQGLIPSRGDRIRIVSTNEIYEVLALSGEQTYRMDPEGIEFRIHSKRVNAGGDAPTAAISSDKPDPTNESPITLTILWSEEVYDFDQSDVIPVGANIDSFTPVNTREFTVVLTPTVTDGPVGIDLPPGAALSLASDVPSEAATFRQTYDVEAPGITLDYTGPDPTNSTQPITMDSSEALQSFSDLVFDVTNGTASNLQQITPTQWTVDITGGTDGLVSVFVPAGSVFDLAGNANTLPSNTVSWTYDITAPEPLLIAPAKHDGTQFEIQVQFLEDVFGFEQGDLLLTNANLDQWRPLSASDYRADVTAIDPDASVGASVQPGVCTDAAGNPNVISSPPLLTIDPLGTVGVTITAPTESPAALFGVTIDFEEPVDGFDQTDFQVTNGTVSAFTTSDDQQWTCNVTATTPGPVTMTIAAGVATAKSDNRPNSPAAAGTLHNPPVTTDVSAPVDTEDDPFRADIVFGEPVDNFLVTSIDVGNGTPTNLQTVDNISWTVDINPAATGNVTVQVPADAAESIASGAGNLISNQTTTLYKPPVTVQINNAPSTSEPTSWPIEIDFSEPVQDFLVTDIDVGNGSASNLTGGPQTYGATITAAGPGDVTQRIPADVASSIATAVLNQASPTETTNHNPPFGVTVSEQTPDNFQSTRDYTAMFDEPVTWAYQSGDIAITSGNAAVLTPPATSDGGTTWTYQLRLNNVNANATVTHLINADVANSIASDRGNDASTPFNSTYTARSISTTLDGDTVSNNGNATLQLVFTEDMDGVEPSDFSITPSGSIQSVTPTLGTREYDVAIIGMTDGTVSVTYPADRAQATSDGRNNDASNTHQISVSIPVNPQVTSVERPPSELDPEASTKHFRATFTEPVTWAYQLGDINVTNGTVTSDPTTVNQIDWDYEITVNNVDLGTTVTHFIEAGVADGTINPLPNLQGNTVNTPYTAREIKPDFSGDSTSTDGAASITLTFDEDVVGVEIADFSLSSGSIDSLTPVNQQVYDLEISGMSVGNQTVDFAAGGANAASDNRLTAAPDQWTIAVTPVTATLAETTVGGPTVSRKTFRVTFGEAVTWTYQAGDIDVTNGTVVVPPSTVNNVDWDFECDPTNVNQATTVNVFVEAGVADSATSIPNEQSNTVNATYDLRSIKPVFGEDSVSSDGTATVRLTFTEDMQGVEQTDFAISDGSIDDFRTISLSVYEIDIVGMSEGVVTVDYAADQATATLDGRNNDAADQWTITVTFPAVVATITGPAATELSTIPFAVNYSEPVDWAYQAGDIQIPSANAVVSATPTTSNDEDWDYSLAVSDVNSPAAINHFVAADSATSKATSKGNDQSNTFATNYTPRTITTDLTGPPTSGPSATLRLVFSEDMTNVFPTDFDISSGQVDSVIPAIALREYDVQVSGMADGTQTVQYRANEADAMLDGRFNDASNVLQIEVTSAAWDPDDQSEDLLGALWDGASPPTEFDVSRGVTRINSELYPSMGDRRPVNSGQRLTQHAGNQSAYTDVNSSALTPTYPMTFFVEVVHPLPLNFETTRPCFSLANPSATNQYVGPGIGGDADSDPARQGGWHWHHRNGGNWIQPPSGIAALRNEPTRAVQTYDSANFRQMWAYDAVTRLWTHATDNTGSTLLSYGTGRIGWGVPRSSPLTVPTELCLGAWLPRLATAQEIEDFRESGRVPLDCTVVHACDEQIGAALYDSSGNAHHATVYNHTSVTRQPTRASSLSNDRGFTWGNGSNGAAAGVVIPIDLSNPTQDVLGNALEFTGRAPLDGTAKGTPAISTDAGGQRIDVQDASILSVVPGDTIEVECLMLVQEWGTQGGLGKVDISENRGWALVTAAPNTNYRFRVDAVSNGNGQMRVNTQDPIVLNRWVHVRAAWDGTNAAGVQMWIDGVPQSLTVTDDNLSGPPDYSGLLMRIGRTSAVHQTTGAFANLRITHNGVTYRWPLNEAAGTLLRETEQNKYGQFIGAVLPAIWRRQQDLQAVGHLWGNDTKMRFTSESLTTNLSFQTSGRIAAQIAVDSGSGLQIGMGNVGSYIGIRDGNPVCAAGGAEVVGTTVLELTQAADIEMRWTGANAIELWVNGVQEGSGSGNPSGVINLGDSSMQGPVANARIYNGAGVLTNHWTMSAARDWQRARTFRESGFRGVLPTIGDGENFMVVAWCLDNGADGGVCADFRSGAYWLMQTNYGSQFVRFYFNATTPAQVAGGTAQRDAWMMLSMDYDNGTTTGHGELWFQSGQHGTDEVTMDRSGLISTQLDVGQYNLGEWFEGKIGPIAIFKPADPPAVRDAINAKMHGGGRGARLSDFTPQEIADWGLVAFYECNEGNGPLVNSMGGPSLEPVGTNTPGDGLGVDGDTWEDSVGGQHLDFTTLSQNFQNFSGDLAGVLDSSGVPVGHSPADGMVPALGESISLTQDQSLGWPNGQAFPRRHREHNANIQGREDLFASDDIDKPQRRFLTYRENIDDPNGARDYVNE